MRIYFVTRNIDLNYQIDKAITKGPDCILEIGKSPLPVDPKISIRKRHLESSTEINNEIMCVFDVAKSVGNSETGDLDIFVYRI